jgi:hypothetical protein
MKATSDTVIATLTLCTVAGLFTACAEESGLKTEPDDLEMDVYSQVREAGIGRADGFAHPNYRGQLRCSADIEGSFDARARYHLYTIDGSSIRQVSLVASETDGRTDTVLAVYEPDTLEPVAVNDDCEAGTYDSCLYELDLELDGEYVVLITTYGRRSWGSYRLSADCHGTGWVGDGCDSESDCQSGLGCVRTNVTEGRTCQMSCASDADCTNALCLPVDDESYCLRPDDCDDGLPLSCRMAIPTCATGLILAFQEGCYACVELETCLPPSVNEEALCNESEPCADGLRCIGRPHDGSDEFGLCRDTTHIDGEGESCSNASPCGEDLVCAMLSSSEEGMCVPAWMAGSYTGGVNIEIPDNDPAGVEDSVVVRGLATVPTDIVLHLDIGHTWRGDLRVLLVDPNGQEALITDREGSSADDLIFHGPVSGISMDDSVNGRWTLRVSDNAAYDRGTIRSWSLDLISRWD